MEDRIAPDQLTDASNTRGLEEGIARNNELLEKLIAQAQTGEYRCGMGYSLVLVVC